MTNEQEQCNQAWDLIKAGNSEKAFELCSEVLKTTRQSATAFHHRGYASALMGDFDEAIDDFSKAIDIDPHYAEAYCDRGAIIKTRLDNMLFKDIILVTNEHLKALKDYEMALKINPNYAEAYSHRAKIFSDSGAHTKAIIEASTAIEKSNKTEHFLLETYSARALSYFSLGQYDKAIEDYTNAIEITKGQHFAYANRGYTYFKKEEYDNAIKDYDIAIELSPYDSTYFYIRGLSYLNIRKYDKAIIDFNKALEIEPGAKDILIAKKEAQKMLKR